MNKWTFLLVVAVAIIGGVVLLFLIRPRSQTAQSPIIESTTTSETSSSAVGSTVSNSNPSSVVSPPSSESQDADQKARFVTATATARQWQTDAQLFGIDITTDSLQSLSGTYESYIYASQRDRGNWYIVTINAGNNAMVRQLSPKVDLYADIVVPVNLTFFKVSPSDALAAAQADPIGATVLADGQVVSYDLKLYHGPPKGHLGWSVTFNEATGTKTTVLINANTAEVSAAPSLATP